MKALKKWFPLISLICGVLALAMIILPAGSLLGEDFKGTQISFGDSDKYLEFSILNTLSFVIGVVGGALAFLGAKNNNKMMKYAAIACFVVGVILFICSKNFVQFDSVLPSAYVKELRKEMKAEIGSILAVIFCIIGAASTVADVVVKDE
jgi:hypothetical protein